MFSSGFRTQSAFLAIADLTEATRLSARSVIRGKVSNRSQASTKNFFKKLRRPGADGPPCRLRAASSTELGTAPRRKATYHLQEKTKGLVIFVALSAEALSQ